MAEEEFYEEVSDEEKLQIAQHFLLSSPPGQFGEVLAGTCGDRKHASLPAFRTATQPD